jgi:hypothetical protein
VKNTLQYCTGSVVMVGVLDLSSPAPVMVSAPTVTTKAATTEIMILIMRSPLPSWTLLV